MKKTIIITLIAAVAAVIVVAIDLAFKNGMFVKKTSTVTDISISATKKEQITTCYEVIEIKGAVKYPGIYVFDYYPVLINDVIQKAGGTLKTANLSGINLVEVLSNHSSIYIASDPDVDSYVLKSGEVVGIININTANKTELMTLPGIGEAIALRIISYREANGFFKNVEEIKNVKGIGESVYEKIKGSITV